MPNTDLQQQARVSDLLRRGLMFQEKGKLPNALRAFDDALAIDPASAEAHCHHGNALADMGEIYRSLASYERAIALEPGRADSYDLRGAALAQLGQFDDALRNFDQALSIDPHNLDAQNHRALALKHLARFDEALTAFDRVIENIPAHAAAHHDRAYVLAELERYDEALSSFDRTIALDPSQASAHCNRATTLAKLGRNEEAIDGYRRALAIEPDQADALLNLARSLASLQKFDEAAPLFQRLLRQEVNNEGALHGLGQCLEKLGRLQDALACFDHLISVKPDAVHAHQSRGLLLRLSGDHEAALASYDRAAEVAPDLFGAHGDRLHTAMFLSLWDQFDERLASLCDAVLAGTTVQPPFPFLALKDDARLQRKCASIHAERRYGALPILPPLRRHPPHERVRVAYFSADFHDHATMQLFLETLEAHDRDRFEFYAFSFGNMQDAALAPRIEAAFDRILNVTFMSDREIAEQARELEVDIAVDLKGYTKDARMGIFAMRAAPIQMNYLGYPGTSGLPSMDYILADQILIPEGHREYYSEKVICLQGCYQPNTRLAPRATEVARAEFGLPEDAVVYCCFNQNYKILPDTFSAWMRILGQVDGSLLWLWVDNDQAQHNLRREARLRGVDDSRLIFAKRAPHATHLARLKLADLFLDTAPCNAHTTASDALRAGLPVLTVPGETFASRVAASLLDAAGLRELILPDLQTYETLAIALGNDPVRLKSFRASVENRVAGSRLFDPASAARQLEAAYLAAYGLYRNGQQPAAIIL